MITIWRRHVADCPHRDEGRAWLKCSCPLWADGYVGGKRQFRQSLKTRDLARARKRAADLEADDRTLKPVPDAVKAFLENCRSKGLSNGSIRKYTNALDQLTAFCETEQIDSLHELTAEKLDRFRAGRTISQVTSSKELELLRVFFKFCFNRSWTKENPAGKIELPRNLKPNDVVPYTPAELTAILMACDRIGKRQYERLRARAMILIFRYTALRIGDVAFLAKDRISPDGDRWRIFLRTEKSGQPVFLPVPPDLKAALDNVPAPMTNVESRYFFWNGTGKLETHKGHMHRLLNAVFNKSGVKDAHPHRFRHTLATELLGRGATFEEVADILGNSPAIVRKHYGKWSAARQSRIDSLMERVYIAPVQPVQQARDQSTGKETIH